LVRILWHQFLKRKKTCKTVETYKVVTSSKTLDRTYHFSIRRSHASMKALLNMKVHELDEVYFACSEFCGISFGRKTSSLMWLRI
jgi:hypothetical protein